MVCTSGKFGFLQETSTAGTQVSKQPHFVKEHVAPVLPSRPASLPLTLSCLPDDVLTHIFHVLFSSFYLGCSLSSLRAVRSWVQVNRQFYQLYRLYISRIQLQRVQHSHPPVRRYRSFGHPCCRSRVGPFAPPLTIGSIASGDVYVTDAIGLIHSGTRALVISDIHSDQIHKLLKATRDVKAHIRTLCIADSAKSSLPSSSSRYARTVSTIRTLRALCVFSPTPDLLSRMRRPSFPRGLQHLALHGLTTAAFSALIDYLHDRPHDLVSLSVETGVSSTSAPIDAMYVPSEPSALSVPGTILLHDTALHLLLEYSISSLKLRYTPSSKFGACHIVPSHANDDIETDRDNTSEDVDDDDEEDAFNTERSQCYCSLCSESVTAHLAHIDSGRCFIEGNMRKKVSFEYPVVHGNIHGGVYSSFGTLSSGLIPQDHPKVCMFASSLQHRKHFMINACYNPELHKNVPLATVSNTHTVTADTSEMVTTFRQMCLRHQYKYRSRFQSSDFKSIRMVKFQPIQMSGISWDMQQNAKWQTTRVVGEPTDMSDVESMFKAVPMEVTFLRVTAFNPHAAYGVENMCSFLSSISRCPRLAVLDIPLSTMVALLDQGRCGHMLRSVPSLRLLHLRGLPHDGICTHVGRRSLNPFIVGETSSYCGDACNRMVIGLSKLPHLVTFLIKESVHLARLDWHVDSFTITRIQQWSCACASVRAFKSVTELERTRDVYVTSVKQLLQKYRENARECNDGSKCVNCCPLLTPEWTPCKQREQTFEVIQNRMLF